VNRRSILAGLLSLMHCLAACRPAASLDPVPLPDPRTGDPAVLAQFEEARALLATQRFGEAGRIYHAYAMHGAAAAAYRNAVKLQPDDFSLRYLLADVEHTLGNGDAAVALLERSLELRPDDPAALRALAAMRLERHEAPAARRLYEALLRVQPQSATALAGIGRAALAGGDAQAAVEYLGRALQAAPEASALRYPLGLAYRELGDDEQAAALLAERGEVAPPFDDPYLDEVRALAAGIVGGQNLGMELLRRGRTDEALRAFATSVERNPGDPRLQANLGHALMQDGRPEEALRAFDEALRLDPGYTTARFNRGAALAALGRDEHAVAEYRRVLRDDAAMVPALYNMAGALRRLARFDEALPPLAEAIRLQPTHAGARLAQALTLIRLGRHGEAAARLAEAALVLPEDRALLLVRVRLLAASPDDRVRDGRLAAELARRLDDRGAYQEALTLAMVAAENGDFAGAARVQRAVLQSLAGRLPATEEKAVRDNLQRYERGEPCRAPWPPGDPPLAPVPASISQ